MNTEAACLGCGEPFDWSDGECPDCGWSRDQWAARGRHGLEKEGHGEPNEEGTSGGTGGGMSGLGPIR
ncbi:hypothetical protein [Halorubrum lacusprofundi]|jgi:hypothetical protein|uniref:Uncharacterized protein n=1 Tax=Halorubrum lacusprofundi (strain ATCC 49239 / DSM 5036 / JCM 8891 / ACAM 34) TaxID=416348 RepID=B9LUH2_HALLT|nr:hypothetical protein [Halorubrum lacusprofundi]ACM56329.1 hypothetical protein Hlac_0727 [Halorubrum lacusprofundi ATCC 49239]MCG1005363.1 hypothetical protein [Halorubrum lacusprofundi]